MATAKPAGRLLSLSFRQETGAQAARLSVGSSRGSSKIQGPSSKEVPNPQAPNTRAPLESSQKARSWGALERWNLELIWSLELGLWSLRKGSARGFKDKLKLRSNQPNAGLTPSNVPDNLRTCRKTAAQPWIAAGANRALPRGSSCGTTRAARRRGIFESPGYWRRTGE